MPSFRQQLVIFTTLSLVCLFFFYSGAYTNELWERTPDFSQYAPTRTLSRSEFPVDDSMKRVIIFGDIHGMNEPFHHLLKKAKYRPEVDTLIHAGDIIAKGPHSGSMDVIGYMAAHNVTGVRGNHDQKIVEWRAWQDWIATLPGGGRWLNDLYAALDLAEPDDPEAWAVKYCKHGDNKRWAQRIPAGWKMLGDHYRIARALTTAQYDYLRSLPLVLHVPSAHTFITHAGLLPSDPRYRPTHSRQPLAHVPSIPTAWLKSGTGSYGKEADSDSIEMLRHLQEIAILRDVPQNSDPWVTLNMRGVLDDHSITRDTDGTPWAEIWNRDMEMCAGFGSAAHGKKLPCHPASVIYGHAASRGLDPKRWSTGLDSGCVKGKRLSAMIIEAKTYKQSFDAAKATVPFGIGSARLLSVAC
ncbi:unnamed protein product [Mycena citricolor]|uniref:Calcineurin-like phosphoesterase domain-containing protein n=1 Tax=Mycena citricolor TaxID=2018698 RepID=A0AAD2H623_9AGAR|nr:unnamed protein product [Mycena citricolor]